MPAIHFFLFFSKLLILQGGGALLDCTKVTFKANGIYNYNFNARRRNLYYNVFNPTFPFNANVTQLFAENAYYGAPNDVASNAYFPLSTSEVFGSLFSSAASEDSASQTQRRHFGDILLAVSDGATWRLRKSLTIENNVKIYNKNTFK